MTTGPRLFAEGRDLTDDFWTSRASDVRVVPARYRKTATVLAARIESPFVVDTPEGRMTGEPGDFLVTDDPPTHAWPVRSEVFERTHEALR